MDLGLKDQVVFITGASRGIGRATAELLVAEGCSVAITGARRGTLRRAVDELGGGERVLGVRGDMSGQRGHRARGRGDDRALRAHRRARHVRGHLARRPAREPHRGGVVRQPEPEVHGLRALLPRGDPAHARARQRGDRARRRQRRPEAELLGDDRRRGERGRHQLRVVARRAVRPEGHPREHRQPRARSTPTAGTASRRRSRATRASTSRRPRPRRLVDPARADLHAAGGREPRRVPRLAARELRQRRAHPDRRRAAQGAHGHPGRRARDGRRPRGTRAPCASRTRSRSTSRRRSCSRS